MMMTMKSMAEGHALGQGGYGKEMQMDILEGLKNSVERVIVNALIQEVNALKQGILCGRSIQAEL